MQILTKDYFENKKYLLNLLKNIFKILAQKYFNSNSTTGIIN